MTNSSNQKVSQKPTAKRSKFTSAQPSPRDKFQKPGKTLNKLLYSKRQIQQTKPNTPTTMMTNYSEDIQKLAQRLRCKYITQVNTPKEHKGLNKRTD